MKKLLLMIFLCLVISAIRSEAQTAVYTAVTRNIATADQYCASSDRCHINNTGAAFHQLTWTVNGTLSACSVQVDSSANGVTWNSGDIIATQTCTSNGQTLSTSNVVNWIRVNVTTITPVASGTLTVNLSGYVTSPSGGGGNVTTSGLTSGRVVTSSGANAITDSANFTFNGTTPRAPGIPAYANNTAALAGGLVAGDFYRSGADPDVLRIVHALPSTPTIRNATHFVIASGASPQTTTIPATAVGNMLVIVMGGSSAQLTPSASGATFTNRLTQTMGLRESIWSAFNISAGITTLTITHTGTPGIGGWCFELAGVSTSIDPWDTVSFLANAFNVTNVGTGTITPAAPGLGFGVFLDGTGAATAYTAGSGWTAGTFSNHDWYETQTTFAANAIGGSSGQATVSGSGITIDGFVFNIKAP